MGLVAMGFMLSWLLGQKKSKGRGKEIMIFLWRTRNSTDLSFWVAEMTKHKVGCAQNRKNKKMTEPCPKFWFGFGAFRFQFQFKQ